MKPKAALVKDGFLPAGSENIRGRLSGAAIARCKELAAQGWDIEGYSVTKSISAETTETVVTKSKPTGDFVGVADVPDESRPEANWEAFTYVGGTKRSVGMRTVCNQCNSSLTYCRCRMPYVWLDHDTQGAVVFTPRPTSKV